MPFFTFIFLGLIRQLLRMSIICFSFALKLKHVENIQINNLLNLSFATKEIQLAFKRYVKDLNFDVPVESFGVLFVVHYYNTDVIQQDIAEIVKKDKSAILRQIDYLEKKNLVQRIVDQNDRRRNIIKITDEGVKFINKINIKLDEFFSLLSQELSPSEIEIFNNILDKLRNKARML